MRIQSIQNNNTNFQGLGHKLVRMQKIQEGEKIAQRFAENVIQENKKQVAQEVKQPNKEWYDNWFNSYINNSVPKTEAVISEATFTMKNILGVLSNRVVQKSKGKKLDSEFIINTINYLINEAKPEEKSTIIQKMLQLPKIDYNRVDKNDISILEHILNAEDFELLNLVNKTQLNYYPPLDYTYERIENDEFKQEVDKLNLNFKNLKDAVKSENLDKIKSLIDDFVSPFYKREVQGKELTEIALDSKSVIFYDDFIQIYDPFLSFI